MEWATGSPHVVVIEDEPGVARLLCDILEDDGYAVSILDHPLAARWLRSDDPPDLILIDIMLPHQDGLQLAADLRRRGLTHTPMIAMSASRIKCAFASHSGLFQDTIVKPFAVDTVRARVRELAGRYVT